MGNIQQDVQGKSKKSGKKSQKFIQFTAKDDDQFLVKDLAAPDIRAFIQHWLENGAAVMFVRSRDGGAHGIKLFSDDFKTQTFWIKSPDDLETITDMINDALSD